MKKKEKRKKQLDDMRILNKEEKWTNGIEGKGRKKKGRRKEREREISQKLYIYTDPY